MLETISAWLTLGGAAAAFYILSWQIRARPHDRQQWAAMATVACIGVVLLLAAWRNLGGPPIGASPHGVVAYCVTMLALIWWAWETRLINIAIIRKRSPKK